MQSEVHLLGYIPAKSRGTCPSAKYPLFTRDQEVRKKKGKKKKKSEARDSTDPGSDRSDGLQEGGTGHETRDSGIRGLTMLWSD